MESHWRDSLEWGRLGLPMSSPSDEACKMYDATLSQIVHMHQDESIGGLSATIGNMMAADPNCVMGHVITAGMEQIGTGLTPVNDAGYKQKLKTLASLVSLPGTNEREKLHARALQLNADGYLEDAVNIWESILFKYPLDILALKFAYVGYIYLGASVQMRDSVARVIPHWKPDMPHYSFLFGMHGFALNETNMPHEGEKQSRKGLELNPRDGWATHSIAHIMEHQGRQDEGISFLESTVQNWAPIEMVACHNYWHKAVFHIEKGEYQSALDIFDSKVGRRAKTKNIFFNLLDATSLLFRLELEGVDVGGRWQDMYEKALHHVEDHSLAFGDAHVMMAYLGAQQKATAQKLMDGMAQYIQRGDDTYTSVTKVVGRAICQSLIAYNDGDYAAAVEFLHPKRYLVFRIGGSVAQRDVFNLLLIQACIKSPLAEHNRLARHLLAERKAIKENAPMTDRLMTKALTAQTFG